MINRKIEDLWWKLLLVVLIFCGFLILTGYLYYINSPCYENPWNCLEFEIIMFGGGVLTISFPIIIILFLWELFKKIREKRENNKF
jgi:TRAP-type C4-dicarboxylate transport system permease small subunit